MLTQAHLVPLTEENLKKHQRETTTRRTSLKKSTTRPSKSGKSLRSAGDGESIGFISNEAVKTSLDELKGYEKQTFDQKFVLPSDPTCVVPENMSKHTEANPHGDDSKPAEVETSSKAANNRISNEEKELSGDDKVTEPDDQKDVESYGRDDEGTRESENDGSEDEDSDESSSSPLESDSDVTVPAKPNKSCKEAVHVDSNDTAGSARSSASESDDDDDEEEDEDDDDDDDSTDDNEDEEEVQDGTRSEDELTHYTSSLNASVSSIPTLYDDREASVQSPTTSAEETPRVGSGQGNEKGELLEQEPEADVEDIKEVEAEKVEGEEPLEKEQDATEKEQGASDYTPPGSRKVSGRSATPKTVVLSEFDDVESTIFDRRENSGQRNSSRNKSTTSMNSGKSDVSIKNWAEFARAGATSNGEGVTQLVAVPEKAKGSKRLKTRKMRNANKPNRVETKNSRAKEKKQLPASNLMAKKISTKDIKRQLPKKTSISSENSVAVTKLQTKIVRRKRRSVKQVSFDKANIQNPTKIITSDSAIFGSRTESRGEEQPSPKPPESDYSDRASSRWSAVETERASTFSSRPLSTAQSTRSSVSLNQRSRQTSLVEKVTAVNHPPVITGKKAHLPALRYRRGK